MFHQPWPLSPAVASRLGSSQLVEEERTPYYNADQYYPARLGEVLHKRYQIVTKLGYCSSSTVWLARDLRRLVMSHGTILPATDQFHSFRWLKERYVAIEINATSGFAQHNGPESELAMVRRID